MNYLAHGMPFVANPYYVAGTAVPDWLAVVDRKVRVRSRSAEPFAGHLDPRYRMLARGIMQHHHDDGWFHSTPAFNQTILGFAQRLRNYLPEPDGHRPGFLGHILVEILIDSELILEDPARVDQYYEAVGTIDPHWVETAVGEMAGRSASRLGYFIQRFLETRFLYDYLDDAKLLERLNMVMHRVRLSALPANVAEFFPQARQEVRGKMADLLRYPAPRIIDQQVIDQQEL